MNLTVLFDLDDTLLHTNVHQFLPIYFQKLGEAFSHIAPQEKIEQQIKYAVQQMKANQDPARMLSEVFAESFYPPLGTSEEACQEEMRRFYQVEFPKLQKLTQRDPHVDELIAWCQDQNMTLGVATNPYFPRIATEERINWAGLDQQDFAFFSTMDNFHFTKPNLMFFTEALGYLGWSTDGMVMIGDSPYHDLTPVEAMGYPTFLVDNETSEMDRPHGQLSDVRSWLEGICQKDELPLTENPEVHLAILRSTPAVFDTWLRGIPEPALRKKPAKDEWSVLEVLWHLADMENEVYKPQWRQLLSDPSKLISPPDTSRWAKQRGYQARDLSPALSSFLKARLSSLSLIDDLITKGMSGQSIRHSILSHAKISELIGFVAKHDRIHLHQCYNLLNFC